MTFQFKLAAFACAGVPVPIYNDGSFSAQWSINSAGLFAEMGTERNGFFVR